MKALVLDQPGAFKHLRIADVPTPDPAPGMLRVKVSAVGLNPVDYKLLLGGHPDWKYPFILGLDVAGEVDAVGSGMKQWQIGDRVMYHGKLTEPGGYAEYTVTPAHIVARMPDNITYVEAAAIPCAGMTAYQAIDRKLNLKSGATILVQAGAGGVGGFAIQLAAKRGATVLTTCSPRNTEYVKKLGAIEAIDYHTSDTVEQVFAYTNGRGVDAVIDTLGTKTATDGLKMLAFGGALVCVESLPAFEHWSMFGNGISVHEIALGGVHFSSNRREQEDLGHMASELSKLVSEGHISPMINKTITLEQIPDALRLIADRHVRGKIVAEIT